MKKQLLFLMILGAFCCSGAGFRIDISGLAESVKITSSLQGTKHNSKINGGRLIKINLFPESSQWQKFELKFTSPQAAQISITLRTADNKIVFADDLSAEGFQIGNGDFEKVNSKKKFAVWRGEAVSVVTAPAPVRSGKYSGKITESAKLSQRGIRIPAGTTVTLSGYYRNEKVAPPRKKIAVPQGANGVYDPTFDTDKPLIISKGRLELHPTFENCSVYLNLLPSEYKKKLNVSFFFRKSGSKQFIESLPPSEIIQENAWRGSLLHLEENTSYEFKAVITGNGYKKEIPGKFRTLNSNVPSETIALSPGKCTVKILSGTPEKYKRYTSNGKTITAVKGSTAVFELKDMENIIFENMVIDAKGAQHGFKLDNCRNIIIRNCEVYNFGRQSAGPRYGTGMYYSGGMYDAAGNLLYDDLAFKLFQTKNVLIERCFVHDPAYPSQTWLYAHPSGPGCIKVTDCANTVVRWNDFVGRDNLRFIDHIIGPPNGSFRGGFARDADIYGNLFAFSNDDGAELEGGAMNIRCYGNRIEGTLSGISTGPITLGPTYLIGNLFANPGDDDASFGGAYKNGGGTAGKNHTRGTLYMLHNTVADAWITKYGVGNFSIPHKDFFPTRKAYLRNNILRAQGRFFHRLWPTFKTDCNGDLLERIPGGNPETVALDKAAIKTHGFEKNGIFAPVAYASPLTGNYAIKKGAPGYNQAMRVNNITGYPHCGAYQGYPGEWFPKRPLAMNADKTELHWLKDDFSVRTIKLTAGAEMKFRVIASDNFYSVTEKSSTLSGKKREYLFEVRLHPEKMKEPRRYSGAILFRTSEGFSLPVTLFADGRIPLEKAISDPVRFMRAKKISAQGKKYVYESTVPAPGIYFMMVRGSHDSNFTSGKINFTFNGEKYNYELVKGSKNWMLLKSLKLRRLVPLTLSAGKTKFEFESLNGVTVEEVVLTKEPWVLLRNREYQVKGKK